MKNTFMLKRIAAITLVLFSFTFGASLFVPVNTVEADDNYVVYIPYTRYYYCGTPGTNSYGVVHTKIGTDKETYYYHHYNPNEFHKELVRIISPPGYGELFGVRIYEYEHIDHPTVYYTVLPTTEHINLDRYHWRCR